MAKRHRLRPTLAERQADGADVKVRVRFLRRRDVKDHNGKVVDTFLEGEEYDLNTASAARWVELLGVAVYADDDDAIAALAERVAALNTEGENKDGVTGDGQQENSGAADGENKDGADESDDSDADGDGAGGKPGADNGGKRTKPGNVSRKR